MNNKNDLKNGKGDKGYRIVRLVNGERLIAKIVGSNSNKLYLERPMSIKGFTATDPSMLVSKEFLTLHNWIEFSSTNKVGIPREYVLTISDAGSFIEDAYDKQKEHEDVDDGPNGISDEISDIINEELLNNKDGLTNLINDVISGIVDNYSDDEVDELWEEDNIDKNREDYGNDLSDWSPYPEDYK